MVGEEDELIYPLGDTGGFSFQLLQLSDSSGHILTFTAFINVGISYEAKRSASANFGLYPYRVKVLSAKEAVKTARSSCLSILSSYNNRLTPEVSFKA